MWRNIEANFAGEQFRTWEVWLVWQKIKQNKFNVIIIAASAAVCGFLSQDRYTAYIMCTMGLYTIAVTGLDILFGYSGQISFGHAGFYLVGAYTTGVLTVKYGIPPMLGLLMGAILAAVVGIILAFPASKLVHHFLSFLTIAFGNIMYSVVSNWHFVGGFSGLSNIPKLSLFGFALDSWNKYFVFVGILVLVMLLVKYRIINSRTGRAFIAIRDSTPAANGCGVNVMWYKIMAFAISAFYTGLAGGLYAHLVGFISPDTFTLTQSILFMTMLLFGGMGSFSGPVLGAVMLTLIQIRLQFFTVYQMLIYAVFIIMVLFFMPNGLHGIFNVIQKFVIGKVKRKGNAHVEIK
jgi:branched-chain amino acid transport system permease protein